MLDFVLLHVFLFLGHYLSFWKYDRHFGTGAEVSSGHFGPISSVPKCLGAEVS